VRTSRVPAALLISWVLATACTQEPARPPVLEIATTTSVQNSGLLEALLPHFSGATVRAHATGSGRALEMMARGDVPLVISHAPETEARYLEQHRDWRYRKIAFNRFVIVGPVNDPAGVKSVGTAVDAFRRIAATKATFVSRGDGSGTHEREERLWTLAGAKPPPDRLLVSGRGMAQALRHADETRSYTLADEATFWQLDDGIELAILVEGDPVLLNTYAVIHDGSLPAAAFAEWLSTGDGRRRMADHQVAGRPAFTVWPASCPGDRPASLPCGDR
jgi:tungstate transport system substrate-binding protein